MSTVRLRRLTADYAKLREYVRLHPRVKLLHAEGDPPERFKLEYHIRSLRMVDGKLHTVKEHLVEITLPQTYPRTPPQCRMLSPVFHPNIAPHAICVGDHWSAGETLQSIVTRIGEILAYQSYNVKSPLNGEAARWVEENKDELPLDRVNMLADESGQKQGAGTVQPSRRPAGDVPVRSATREAGPAAERQAPPPPRPVDRAENTLQSTTISATCPSCSATYQVRADYEGRKVRCKKCMSVFEVSMNGSAG